jgi:hypothetical protein
MNPNYKNLNIPPVCNLDAIIVYQDEESGWINTGLIKRNITEPQWSVLRMHREEVMSSHNQGVRHTNWVMWTREEQDN